MQPIQVFPSQELSQDEVGSELLENGRFRHPQGQHVSPNVNRRLRGLPGAGHEAHNQAEQTQ